MRDLDEIEEHEVKQQELLQKITTSLHQATSDNENYLDQFYGWGENIISILRGTYAPTGTDEKEFDQLIVEPIKQFAPDVREQHYLLLKVLRDKIINSIASKVVNEYEAAQYEFEPAADSART